MATSLPSASLTTSFYSYDPNNPEPRFVNPDTKYTCTSCQKFLQEPVQTTCGHRYCKTCFEQELDKSGEEGFKCFANEEECEIITKIKVNPDFSAVREMGLLLVYCMNWDYGCRKETQLKKLKDHLSDCQFAPVKCPFAGYGCEELLAKDSVDKHVSECNYRPEQCSFCGQLLPVAVIPNHVENECPQIAIPCPYKCGRTDIPRVQIEDHKLTCELRPKGCKFQSMGCKFQGSDAEVEDHEGRSTEEHLELAMIHIMELEVENTKLSGSIQRLISEYDNIRTKINELRQEFDQLSQANQALAAQMKQSEQTQLKLLVSHSEKVLRMEDKMKSFDVREVDAIKGQISRQEERLRSVEVGGRGGLSEPIREQFVNHDRTIASHDVRLAELSLRIQCMETTNHDGVLIWKICDFHRRKNEAANGGTLSLYSQPFYTSRYGYKMCARVYLNGDGAGKGTHVSFFFVVMQGDYDDILRWPFQQKVTLMLMDQKSQRRHTSDTFRPDPASSSFQKPRSPMNVASGCPLFVPHSQLENDDTFMRNETLFFKVIVDTSDLYNP